MTLALASQKQQCSFFRIQEERNERLPNALGTHWHLMLSPKLKTSVDGPNRRPGSRLYCDNVLQGCRGASHFFRRDSSTRGTATIAPLFHMRPLSGWVMRSFFLGKTVIILAQNLIPLADLHLGIPHLFRGCYKGFPGRGLAVSSGGPFSCSVRFHWAGTTEAKLVPFPAGGALSGQKVNAEKLWREFFSDPSQWWDNRSEKGNSNYPDFKHKKTQQGLWLNNNLTPPWVEAELAVMAPGVLQLSIFSWNKRLQRHVKAGDYKKAIDLFQQIQRESIIPDKFTFITVLNACSGLLALEEGKRIHLQVIKSGFECNIFVGSCLIDMYGKCGRMEDARRVFNKLPTRDVVSYNAMILGYGKCGQGQEALDLFRSMQCEGLESSPITFVGVFNACASIQALDYGRDAHAQITDKGYESDTHVASSLVDMYAKCGSIEDARRVFDKVKTRDVVSCNALILGHVKCGQGQEALEIFRLMQREGVDLSPVTFVGVLNACASIGSLEEGRRAHEQVIERGYELDLYVANALVDMYSKCSSIEDARRVFNKMVIRDVVSCNAMITGYVRCGQGKQGLKLFRLMQQEGVDTNLVTFIGVLNACASIGALEEGRRVHKQVIDAGYDSNAYLANSLVDMYAKCGSIEDARRVFNKMSTRDVVSCNTLILGYVKCGQGEEALELFRLMQWEGVDLCPITFVGVLNACARTGALEEGRRAHEQINDRGYECDVYVANSLVDMYARCGSIDDAQRVFNGMIARDVVSYNALILGYVKCGQGKEALELFQRMQQEAVDLDPVTFVGVLNACASIGALEDGRSAHEQINERGYEYDIHVSHSLVDMYAKCGSIEDAERVFTAMPMKNVVAWSAMLGGYSRCGYTKEALGHFGRMCREVQVDVLSFVSVLAACSHGGLVDEGLAYFESMSTVFNVSPTLEHYACVIDLLGRAGHLHEAQALIGGMPCEPDAAVWMSLLGACRIHDNMEMGESIAKQVLALDPGNVAGSVLLSNIYAAARKWDRVQTVQCRRLEASCAEKNTLYMC